MKNPSHPALDEPIGNEVAEIESIMLKSPGQNRVFLQAR